MLRKSRLRTRTKKRRWPITLLIFLGLAAIVAGVGFIYRQKVLGFINVWQETFSSQAVTAGGDIRGVIFDRNFKELAQTLERVSLYVRPREVVNLPDAAEQIEEILALPKSEVLTKLEHDSHLVWLRRDITQEDEELVAELNLPGFYFHRESARSYPEQEKASHLIGYSANDQGLAGVEHYYNRLLSNDRVRQEDQPTVDLAGMEQTQGRGHDLVLTLDMKIQTILEDYVTGIGKKKGDARIASLLIDIGNGKIIAGANYPSYNPNSVWQHDNELLEPLLLTPMVIPDTIRSFFREASLLQGGWEQATQVYPWSLVAGEMNFGRQIRLWDRLQLSTDIHVDFSGGKKKQTHVPQLVSCLPGMDCGAVPRMATPLKVLLGMSHLVNGGKKIQPHILDRVIEHGSQKEYYYDAFLQKKRGRHVLPSLVSQELLGLLRAQGEKAVLGTRVLTGETVSLAPDYSGGEYVRDQMALLVFSGMKPDLMLLIVSRQNTLEPSQQGGRGLSSLTENIDSILPSMVALQQISINIADVVEIQEGDEQNFKSRPGQQQGRAESLAAVLKEHTMLMPDLKGISLRKALRILQRTEHKIVVQGTGRIVSQSPKPGQKLVKGATINLFLKIDTEAKAGKPARLLD